MSKPRYLQIADTLIEKISNGELSAGSILPTEGELQKEFDVSRVTIRKAMQLLVDKDLLFRQRGSGTYVKAPKAQHNALQLSGFVEEVSAQGKTPSSKIITFELIECNELVAGKLDVSIGEEVYSIRRLRMIDDEPEVLEHTYLPVSLFPDLSIKAMRSSKYDYIEKTKGLKIKLSRQSIKPEILDKKTADELNMDMADPIIRVDSVGELESGIVFEYTVHYFRVNQYSFDYIAYR
ncbi:GntR family transcriptional regulator [Vibrio barjaei]|jgi:DNA-binding GntR family transcriptional regulator|uniref:GntR family transcriptional regulator n=1 Tax=Vibrio barjaei TaxID=1676683 RepID=A0ABW7INW6_9VIBR|nr:GntR family transcriptional regulator [Vibrio barjaei]MCG9789441.1 GntR family transcriptional regulator [Vibrio mediterranei]MCY9874373.1 GntR family transcriptional regulator [Vibrio barjaei]OIN26875.1 transcriptional regulator [Vibrio barjaei]